MNGSGFYGNIRIGSVLEIFLLFTGEDVFLLF